MESTTHAMLVRRLAEIVRERHDAPGLVVLAEHATFGKDRPFPVLGFVPDVTAADLQSSFHVIGEAKTPKDLETDRSLRQMTAFVSHIALLPGSCFYLAVPWGHEARAQLVLDQILSGVGKPVHAEVLGLA